MQALVARARQAVASEAPSPLYRRLADALAPALTGETGGEFPSARSLALEVGLNRATVTAAYRELARRGLLVLRPGRRQGRRVAATSSSAVDAGEPVAGAVDLARYAPDRELLPSGEVFRWLGLGEGEGEGVTQYGDAWGYKPLRSWLAARLSGLGVDVSADTVLLTGGVQHALDLLLRALTLAGRHGDGGGSHLPRTPRRCWPSTRSGSSVSRWAAAGSTWPKRRAARRRESPRLAVLTPTLHNPSGAVMDLEQRLALLAALRGHGTHVIEEFFDPAMVSDGPVPPLAALDRGVIVVGSFSKALFPGLRVGWVAGPPTRSRASPPSSAQRISAAALSWRPPPGCCCRRGVFEDQLQRLRTAARARLAIVAEALSGRRRVSSGRRPEAASRCSSRCRTGGAPGRSPPAPGNAESGSSGPPMSVSGRDDIVRVAYAAVGGDALREAMKEFLAALAPERAALPLV